MSVSAATGQYGDVQESNSYYKAIKVLSGLGIVQGDDEGNFNPTNDIKRSEMVALVCRAMGEEAVAESSGGSSFDDVASNHWAAGYIAWGVSSNIVNGVGNNMFDPDASVKFQDAVVMILRALGYERIAQRSENGGYPTGYLKIASQKGVLSGTSYDGDTAATREVVAQVIYNALTTPLVDVSYYAPNPADDEYVVYDGKNGTDLRTLLTYTNEIYKVKAVVENTSRTDEALRKDSDNPKVELDITGTYDYAWSDILDNEFSSKNSTIKPYVGQTEVTNYLGYTVEAYIAENENDEWELLSVVVDSKSTDSETVTANFDSFDATSGTFEYYEDADDSKTTKIKVDMDDLTVYYNGSKIDIDDDDLEDLLVMKANSITFMGPKNDDYNKIFVTVYDFRQVESVRVDDEFVKFTSGSLQLNAEDRDDDTFIYNLYDADGNEITLADVNEDDIFNIVAPLDDGATRVDLSTAPYMDIYVTNESVTGTVGETVVHKYSNGKTEDRYKIDGVEYKVDNNVSSIKVGDEGTFYITIDGTIYDKDASSSISKNFGFIAAVGSESSFGVPTYQVKVFTADNTLVKYDIAQTFRFYDEKGDYKTYKRSDNGQDSLFKAGSGIIAEACAADSDYDDVKDGLAKRFVTFKTNSAGTEVTEIRLAGTNNEDFRSKYGSYSYDEDLNTFAGEDLDSNSILFVAPISTNDDNKYYVDEDKLEIASFSALDEKEKLSAYTYILNDEDYLSAALAVTQPAYGVTKSAFAVVKTQSTGLDADDSTVVKYTFVQGGETKTLAVDYDIDDKDYSTFLTDVNATALSVGDVFQYSVNADDEISKLKPIYDASKHALTTFAKSYPASDYDTKLVGYDFGLVTSIKSSKITIATKVDSDFEPVTSVQYKLNDAEGNTYALYDEAKSSNAVKAWSGVDNLMESAYSGNGKNIYGAVVRVNKDGRAEDVAEILFNSKNFDNYSDFNDLF